LDNFTAGKREGQDTTIGNGHPARMGKKETGKRRQHSVRRRRNSEKSMGHE